MKQVEAFEDLSGFLHKDEKSARRADFLHMMRRVAAGLPGYDRCSAENIMVDWLGKSLIGIGGHSTFEQLGQAITYLGEHYTVITGIKTGKDEEQKADAAE